MIYWYILVMAGVTYLIRVVPLVLFHKKIENRFVRSFLYYVPYACLTAMTIPDVFHSTSNLYSALTGRVAGRGHLGVRCGICRRADFADPSAYLTPFLSVHSLDWLIVSNTKNSNPFS